MKNIILYSIILIASALSINLFAQSNLEKVRAEFLTNYYSKLNNDSKIDDSIFSTNLDSSEIIKVKKDNYKNCTDLLFNLQKLKIVSANCLHSLQNENQGVVESAIFVSIQFKNKFPERNDDKFIEALNELLQNSDSPIISYKAHLAKLYFLNNELFHDIEISSILEEERVYCEISDKINRMRLSAKLN